MRSSHASTAAAAVFLGVWAVASLSWPPGLDQGIFAWVGDTILRGGMPYRDAWEIKGPAIHYLYALAQWLSGGEPWGLRVLDLAALAVGAVAARSLAARMAGTAAGLGAAALLVAFYAVGGHWHAAQPDGFAAFAWLGAAALLVGGKFSAADAAAAARASGAASPAAARWAAAGLVCAFASLLKPFFALFAGLLFVDGLLRMERGVALRAGGWLVLGLVAGLGAAGLGFAAGGALADLIEVQFVFNPSLHPTAYRDLSALDVASVLGAWFSQPWAGLAAVGFAFAVAALSREAPADALLLSGWLALSLVLVVVQNQFFHYHFLPALAVLAVGAAVGTAKAWRGARAVWLKGAVVAFAVALALASAWHPALQVRALSRVVFGELSREAYLDRFGMGSYGFATMRRIADQVRARTEPDDPILVWGFEAGLYPLAHRAPPTRFGFLYPLIRGGGSDLERAYLDEFRTAVDAKPPRYVLMFAQSLSQELPAANRSLIADMDVWLRACYERDTSLSARKLTAWRRTGREDCGHLSPRSGQPG